MENLALILGGMGLDLSHVVQMRAYLTEFERDYAAFNDTYQAYFPEDRRPARTTVGVTGSGRRCAGRDRLYRAPSRDRVGAGREWLAMLRSIPLSPMGWLALLAALGSVALAVVAFTLPSVEDAICPLDGDHTLPSGRAAELCDILPETQPFTSATWLVVRMVVPELPETGSESAHNDHDWVCAEIRFAGGGSAACAHRRATDGGALHQGRTRTGDNPIHRGLHDPGWCLHLGAFVMPIQYFAVRSSKRCQV